MFSSRQNWGLRPNPLSKLLDAKRAAGDPILDLSESNPTHAGLVYPEQEILAALADPRCFAYHPDPRGLLSAREAVSRYYGGRGVNLAPSRMILTASTSEAYGYLFKLLTDPGDDVLVPRPSYPLFEYLAAMESVAARQYPLRYDGGWHVDFDALEAAIGPRTRAIVVVHPNNPTGSFLKREEIDRLDRIAASHGIAILSDEVFSDFAFTSDPARVPTLAGANQALTFSLSGLSKVAGLPQMKLAWIVASGPQSEAALDRLEWIADTFLSVATLVQVALPRLMDLSRDIRAQILDRARTNLAYLQRAADGTSPCRALAVEGGWYATLQIPRTMSEEELTLDLLGRRNVLVQPGFFYDFESEAFLVLSLLTTPPVFEDGVTRTLAAMI